MAKIKLTESQIEMLRKLDSKKPSKVLKITEDQFNRLFANKELSESIPNSQKTSTKITKNFKEAGKEIEGSDLKFEAAMAHPVAGNGGDEYNPQSEEENQKTFQSFNESISEDISTVISQAEFLAQFKEVIRAIISDPSQEGLSPFWVKLGVTWGDFKAALIFVGLATSTVVGGRQVIKLLPKKQFFAKLAKGALRRLYNILIEKRYDMKNGGKVIQQDETVALGERDGDYPAGAEHDPNAPWNQNDGPADQEQPRELIVPEKKVFDLIWFNEDADGMAIFKNRDNLFVHLGGYHDGEQLEPYCDSIHEPNADCVSNYVNDLYNKGAFKVKKYSENFTQNMLTLIDGNVKRVLLHYFSDAEGLKELLGHVTEGEIEETTTAASSGAYSTPKIWAKDKKSMRFAKKPMFPQGKIVEDAPEGASGERFVVELDMYIIEQDEKAAYATGELIAKAINKKFDASARVTHVTPMPYGKIGEGLEGEVVIDDCTKLDNNKVAQNGGCSQGAVDNVVTVKENLFLEVAKKTGRTVEEVRQIIEKHNVQ